MKEIFREDHGPNAHVILFFGCIPGVVGLVAHRASLLPNRQLTVHMCRNVLAILMLFMAFLNHSLSHMIRIECKTGNNTNGQESKEFCL